MSVRIYSLTAAAALALPSAALAHGGMQSEHWWLRWNFDWLILLSLIGCSWLYIRGVRRLWRRAGHGRGISPRRAAAFAAGMGVLFVALVSPIDPVAEELQWVHMIQHKLLMMVAAPLLVAGLAGMALLHALPTAWAGRWAIVQNRIDPAGTWRYLLWQPAAMWLLYAGTLWTLHLPSLYQAVLHHDRLHDLQHILFLVTSCLFWRVLLDPVSRLRMGRGVGVLYLFTTSLHASMLGVFMTLAPSVWYPFYEGTAPLWGLSARDDQMWAGLIMWMPACMLYAVIAAIVLALWLRDMEPGTQPATEGAT